MPKPVNKTSTQKSCSHLNVPSSSSMFVSSPEPVQYVQKRVREKELAKLQEFKKELNQVKQGLDDLDIERLPEEGLEFIEKYNSWDVQFRRQRGKIVNMIVETAEVDLIEDSLRNLHASQASRPAETAVAATPSILSSKLLPHQSQALAWLQWRERQSPRGGILADDMGLGKTITMIALIASDVDINNHHIEDHDDGPIPRKTVRGKTLVVCPASLLQQWKNEIRKHCKAYSMSVILHHGKDRDKFAYRLCAYDVVVTTYNILLKDSVKESVMSRDGQKGVLSRVQWHRVILDEAHGVRNHKSATSRAVCSLRAGRRWCLTGTPVQNKGLDLYAPLKFLRVKPFDEFATWKRWIDNKKLDGQERLSLIMRSIMLRRTKIQLQQEGQLQALPVKTQHEKLVKLTQRELKVYQKLLVLSKSLFAQYLHQQEQNYDSMTESDSDDEQSDNEYNSMPNEMNAAQGVRPIKSHEILVLLLRLRQVCCHCGLIAAMLEDKSTPETTAGDLLHELDKLTLKDLRRKSVMPEKEDDPVEESATAAEAIRAILSPKDPVFQLSKPSAKIKAVMKCLKNNVFVNNDDKAVIVSQWTSVLDLVKEQLDSRRIRSVTLSGAVPVAARPLLIDALNDPTSDVKVMLLSLCAGGVGINLCGANHLLLLDPHWNPQLEEQAQDRIYRVGQKKNVHIYRFLCINTVEERIRRLQEVKLQLAVNVLTGAKPTGASTLSFDDLKMLFNMGPD